VDPSSAQSAQSRQSLRRAAAANNAGWCDAVCRTHGIVASLTPKAWLSPRRPPPYYPDAVTLDPSATTADVLTGIDSKSPGCSVKDSFGTLDLTSAGFEQLFTAQWIQRPAGLPTSTPSDLRAERIVTAAELAAWQTAWQADEVPVDVFRPSLLDNPAVLVLAMRSGNLTRGGAVLNHDAGMVGLSNLFAVDPIDLGAVWSAALAAAAAHYPGLVVVGYEESADLDAALVAGFTILGPLRIWLLR
jgi:hypothetical protein